MPFVNEKSSGNPTGEFKKELYEGAQMIFFIGFVVLVIVLADMFLEKCFGHKLSNIKSQLQICDFILKQS